MPQRDTSGIGERVPIELIDADFTVALSLVEMAEGESRRKTGCLRPNCCSAPSECWITFGNAWYE